MYRKHCSIVPLSLVERTSHIAALQVDADHACHGSKDYWVEDWSAAFASFQILI